MQDLVLSNSRDFELEDPKSSNPLCPIFNDYKIISYIRILACLCVNLKYFLIFYKRSSESWLDENSLSMERWFLCSNFYVLIYCLLLVTKGETFFLWDKNSRNSYLPKMLKIISVLGQGNICTLCCKWERAFHPH